ncbi:MAG: N-acetyltransferase family protein [Candidatus Hodarchaeales archaeon]|jgi:ribosomal protein S18 acetylase RimI-like enzyme
MEIEITTLLADYWEKFKTIRLEGLKNDPIAFGSSYEEEIRFPEEEWRKRITRTIFALSGDKPVGMIVFFFNNRIKTNHVANIFGMYVSKDFRGLGIGKKLMDAALRKIKMNKEIIKINLAVNTVQESAVALYQKYGFKIVGKLSKDILVAGKFYDGFLMELILS